MLGIRTSCKLRVTTVDAGDDDVVTMQHVVDVVDEVFYVVW